MTSSLRLPPPLGGGGHDRQADLRARHDWWEQLAGDPSARVLIVGHGRVAVHDGAGPDAMRVRMLAPAEAAGYAAREPGATRLLLGRDPDGPVAAIGLPEMPDDLTGTHARTVGPLLDAVAAGLVVHALGLDNWHRTHPRCARCGAETDVVAAGHARLCPVCGAQHFPRTDPAVIMLITDADDRALLGHSPAWAEGRYSTLAGFVEPGESLEDAVRREVAEESAVQVGDVEYAGSQPWPFPSSLMLGFFGRALTTQIQVDDHEVTAARWFTRDELSRLCASGDVIVPVGMSISRWLIDSWHGGELTGDWADW